MVAHPWAFRFAYAANVALPAALVAAHARLAPNDPAAQRRHTDMRKVPPTRTVPADAAWCTSCLHPPIRPHTQHPSRHARTARTHARTHADTPAVRCGVVGRVRQGCVTRLAAMRLLGARG